MDVHGHVSLTLSREEATVVLPRIEGIPGVWVRDAGDGVRVKVPRSVVALDVVVGVGLQREERQDVYRRGSPDTPPLHSYQWAAISFVAQHKAVLLAMDLGLGKTITAAVAAESVGLGERPVVVVGPKMLRSTWRNELVKFARVREPEDFVAVEGTVKNFEAARGRFLPMLERIKQARFVYCHYEIVGDWWSILSLAHPKAVICDEAHLLKSPTARRTRAVAAAIGNVPVRILLTATPVLSRLSDLWQLLSLVDGKWTWGTKSQFRMQYCGATYNRFGLQDGPPTNVDELRTRLATCVYRKTVADVQISLPDKTTILVWVEGHGEKYKKVERAFLAAEQTTLAAATRAVLEGRAGPRTLRWFGRLRSVLASTKRPRLVEDAKQMLEQGERVLVFTWRKADAEHIAKALGGKAVTGDTTAAERERTIDGFTGSFGPDQVHALAATYGALGVGVNLQSMCRVVCLLDVDPVPATMSQAIGRVYRQGQERPVLVYKYVCRDSLDEHLRLLGKRKREVTDAVRLGGPHV